MALAISLLSVSPSSATPDGLTPRAPILIVGNDNFTPANGVTSGSGTESDPYIIENWDINAAPPVPEGPIIEDVTITVYYGSWEYDVKTSVGTRITWYLYDINKNLVHTYEETEYWSTNHGGTFGGYIPSGEDGYIHLKAVSRDGDVDWWPSEDEMYKIERENAHRIEIRNTTAHFIVRNCHVHGNSDHYGIWLHNVTNGKIENVISDNNLYGIYLNPSNNNSIENCTASNNERGIHLYDSDNNTLDNNTCENNDGDGIHFSYSSNNILTNSTLKGNERGIQFWDSNNNNVENCVIENNKWRGIALQESVNNTITNCIVENSFRGIELYWSDNNTITDCVVENNYNQCGILIANASDNNVIENNNSSNNTRGIYIADSLEITIKNNVFENDGIFIWGENVYHFNTHVIENNTVNGKPVYYYADISGIEVPDDAGGVILANCSNMSVRNLEISNSTVGIELAYTQDSQITNNLLSHNLGAIYLIYSDNNVITHNDASNNGDGIELWRNSDNNTVKNNVLSNNVYGIELWENSDNNRIYYNNLENNENQAYDDGSNYWDNGYPSGGNYWSDYTGVDNYRGENQAVPGSDGIGDTQYYISGVNNKDRYPLMNPWSQVIPATIGIKPDTLNLKSRGRWITTYIELPPSYNVGDIDASTIMLSVESGNVPAEPKPIKIGDHDHDGIPDLKVRFDRGAVQAFMPSPGEYTLTIRGEVAGVPFEGSKTVSAITRS